MPKSNDTLTLNRDRARAFAGIGRVPPFQNRTMRRSSPSALTIGFVNNMPDSAFEATERQFSRLVSDASGGTIKLRRYVLPSVPRGRETQALITARYRSADELYNHPTDALIVTGTEPKAANLMDEPYWQDLATLIDWAKTNTASTLWSCLAAHAAVLHLDGIVRLRLPAKRSGAFGATVHAETMMRDGLPDRLNVCHSRLNEVLRDDLLSKGYQIVSESAGGHIDMFAKTCPSTFVFLQGHPEYDADSLMREYRRDVGRYLQGERDYYPSMPENYFDAETTVRMEALRDRALEKRDPRLFSAFPEATLRHGLARRLNASASAIFSRWLSLAAEAKVSA